MVDALQWALKLSRPGKVIVLDNVVRNGRVVDALTDHPSVRGTRAAFDFLRSRLSIDSTALQTVGSKGWHGLVLGLDKGA